MIESYIDRIQNGLATAIRSRKAPRRWLLNARTCLASSLTLQTLTDAALLEQYRSLSKHPRDYSAKHTARILAVVLDANRRTVQLHVDEETLVAVFAILDNGCAVLAAPRARAAALILGCTVCAGHLGNVHCLVEDDAQAEQLCEIGHPIWQLFGLRHGLIAKTQSLQTRRRNYRNPVVVSPIRLVIDDFLRDSVADPNRPDHTRQLIDDLSGRHSSGVKHLIPEMNFGLIDRADKFLCDSGPAAIALSEGIVSITQLMLQQLFGLAGQLTAGSDYMLVQNLVPQLTGAGTSRLSVVGKAVGRPWSEFSSRERKLLIEQVLAVTKVLQPNVHYDFNDQGNVEVKPSVYEQLEVLNVEFVGLPEIIAFKEHTWSEAAASVAQVSFRRFASKYNHLGALSAARDATGELRDNYDLCVARSAPLDALPKPRLMIFADEEAMVSNAVLHVKTSSESGSPVLVITGSRHATTVLSQGLTSAGVQTATMHGQIAASANNLIEMELESGVGVVLVSRLSDIDLSALHLQNGDTQLTVMLAGFEDAMIDPRELLIQLPPIVLQGQVFAYSRADHPIFLGSLKWPDQQILNANVGKRWNERPKLADAASRVLLKAINRSAKTARQQRNMAYRYQDHQLSRLAFAGDFEKRL